MVEENIINVENLTKDYGFGRGVFDVSVQVKKGIVYGYLGPNGAGKSTTIRHLMGFSKGQSGKTEIYGTDTWKNNFLLADVGYLPGEIALPDSLTGDQFIKMMAKLRGVTDMTKTNYLKDLFKLDTRGKLKRMSLGNKRKLAIITAFMHDPKVLILDEPTSGLDPVMQNVFINFIAQEKSEGKTILLSSHIFSEVEALCDIVSIIKDGKIVSTFNMKDIKIQTIKKFKIEFLSIPDYKKFKASNKWIDYEFDNEEKLQYRVAVSDADINKFFSALSHFKIKYISEDIYTLEDHFMSFYKKDSKGGANV